MNIINKNTPNFAKWRNGWKPDMIVIHIAEGTAGQVHSTFQHELKSSHYLTTYSGDVWKYVDEENTAWANGFVSNPKDPTVKARTGVNPNLYTISIENEGYAAAGITEEQYKACAELVSAICKRWNIPLDRQHIIRHEEINSLKTCPGKVSVERIIELAQSPQPEPDRTAEIITLQKLILSLYQQIIAFLSSKGRVLGSKANQTMSKTYIGIYTMLLGALAQWLGVPIAEGKIEAFVEVLLLLGGAIFAMYGRNTLGGVTVFGARKPGVLPN